MWSVFHYYNWSHGHLWYETRIKEKELQAENKNKLKRSMNEWKGIKNIISDSRIERMHDDIKRMKESEWAKI